MRVIHFFTFFSSIIGILIGLVMIYGSWIDPEQPLSMIRSIGLTLFAGIIPFFSSRKAIKDRRLNIPHADEMSVLLGQRAGSSTFRVAIIIWVLLSIFRNYFPKMDDIYFFALIIIVFSHVFFYIYYKKVGLLHHRPAFNIPTGKVRDGMWITYVLILVGASLIDLIFLKKQITSTDIATFLFIGIIFFVMLLRSLTHNRDQKSNLPINDEMSLVIEIRAGSYALVSSLVIWGSVFLTQEYFTISPDQTFLICIFGPVALYSLIWLFLTKFGIPYANQN